MTGSHGPNNIKYAYLRQFSTDKLIELLSVAPIPVSSPEDEAYVDALEEAILEKERENPTGFLPDVNQQWVEFQEYYRTSEAESTLPDIEAIFEDVPSTCLNLSSPDADPKPPVKIRRIRRTVFAVAAAVILIFGCMVVAQAAGVDVFGAMARWTEEIFSFGTVRTRSVQNEPHNDLPDVQTLAWQATDYVPESEYSSLQEALDTFHIAEVAAPTWLPEGYMLDQIDILYSDDPETLTIAATYIVNGKDDPIHVGISSYTNEPSVQVEKTETRPETFDVGGITFYMIENTCNYTVAWLTENFECYIEGAVSTEPEILKEIVYSML